MILATRWADFAARITPPSRLPALPHDTLSPTKADDRERAKQTAHGFRAVLELGVLMSLGATDLGTVTGAHQLGGLLFTMRIRPFRGGTRSDAATEGA